MWPLGDRADAVVDHISANRCRSRRLSARGTTTHGSLLWEGSGFMSDALFRFYYFINYYLSFFPL